MIVILLGLLCRLNAGGESAHVPVLELDKLLHQEASDQQRREQGHDNAQQQRLGEALHRAGAEDHQHDGGDNGGHVRVDDGAQRVVEAGLEGNLQAAARADFLIEALEDNDIGVHRHADAQHDTGNARQGQLNAGENRQHPEQHDCVNAQRPGGDHAVQAVADNHDEHDQRDADDGSENGGGQRIIAQRGGHGINLLLRQHQRQRAGLNLRGDGLRTIHREVAGNLTGAAGDGGLHGGRHQLLAVQIDAQRLADVLACHVGKELRARGGQLEGNRPLTVLRHGGLRQTDVRAGHEGVAVRILELQEGGFADQVQDFARIAHIRDFNADAARAQHLHGAFGIALVGQTGLNGGNGHVQHTAPFMGGGGGPAGWGGAIAVVPYEMYKIYGDKETFRRYLPKILRYFDYLDSRSSGGLVCREEEGGWCLGDWCPPEQITICEPFVNTALYVKQMMMTKEASEAIGESETAAMLEKRIEEKKQAILSAYYSPQTGSFIGDAQGANSFAVDIGLGGERAFNNTKKKYDDADSFDTGIFGTDILTRVLFERGCADTAFHLLTSTGKGSFYNMKKQGATTIWENWDGERSHSHPMFGAVTRYLFSFILGITQEKNSAGYEKIVIAPQIPDGLNRASGHITTVRGEIAVSFIRTEREMDFYVTVPQKAWFTYGSDCEYELWEGENHIHIDFEE